MATKRTIAIIGASSNAGEAIARSLVNGPYRLLLLEDEIGSLHNLYTDLFSEHSTVDAEIVDCLVDASWEADIIILAVPIKAEQEVAEKIQEVASCKLVISIHNGDLNAAGLSSFYVKNVTEALDKSLPHSRVVKIFNMNLANEVPAVAHIDGKTIGGFIAAMEQEEFPKHLQVHT